MQYKLISSILFATGALAVPDPQNIGDYSNLIPTGIEQILGTAIPTSWADAFATDPAFFSSQAAAIGSGSFPDWGSRLPTSVGAFFTSEAQAEISSLVAAGSSLAPSDVSSILASSNRITQTGTATTTGSSSGSSSATKTTMTDSASQSVTPSSTASNQPTSGAAPAATDNFAIALAGIAGILGIAIAL